MFRPPRALPDRASGVERRWKPPQRPTAALAAVALASVALVSAAVSGPAAAVASGQQPTGPADHAAPGCETDDRNPWIDDRIREVAFVDRLVNGSTADWDGGHVVRIGASGSCSLAVPDGNTATLTAATVNGSHGVVSGALDLGENGSLSLTGADGNATALALRNEGAAYDTTVVIVADGTVQEAVRTPTGRFFQFTVRQSPNGAARVAVWEPGEPWDGTWDARLNGTATRERWHLRLRGEAYLDGVAVGTNPPAASTPTETAEGESGWDESDLTPFDPEDGAVDSSSEPDGGSGGAIFLSLVMMAGGALGFRYAYAVSQFEERVDAIGSTTPWHEVEPAAWKVVLNRIIFGGIAAVGAIWLLSVLL